MSKALLILGSYAIAAGAGLLGCYIGDQIQPVDFHSNRAGYVSLGDAFVAAASMPRGCKGVIRNPDRRKGWQLEGCK